MTTHTLIFLGGCSLGVCIGFLLAACLWVGGRDEDELPSYGPADWDISEMPDRWSTTPPPEKTLLKNVRDLDKGVEE